MRHPSRRPIFTVAAAATGFLTFVDAFNPASSAGPEFGAQLGRFLVETELGRTWLITTIAGAALTVLTFAVASWTVTLLRGDPCARGARPDGHAGSLGCRGEPHRAVMALVLHIIAAAVWLGGWSCSSRPADPDPRAHRRPPDAVLEHRARRVHRRRGLGQGPRHHRPRRVGRARDPVRPSSAVKVVALVALGVLGAWYRRGSSGRWAGCGIPPLLESLIALELAFMGVASGAAAALARTAPPGLGAARGGYPGPSADRCTAATRAHVERWFTSWDIDLLWAFAAAFGIFFYLAGVWRLSHRGDLWPVTAPSSGSRGSFCSSG